MTPILSDKLDELKALCLQHKVKTLYVFGSATRADFDPGRSDIDFLVEFDGLPPIERANQFFALERDLQMLFKQPVDLGEVDGIRNPFIREIAERTRVPIYAAA